MTRAPLLPIAASFSAGIAVAPYFYLTASEQIGLLLMVITMAALLAGLRRYFWTAVFCWLGFLICGTFFAAAEHAYLPANHLERLARRGVIHPEDESEVTGWVSAPSEQRPGSETFDLQVTGVRQAGRATPASGTIRLYYFPSQKTPASLHLGYGMRLTVTLSGLRRPRNFLTTDAFDWESYMHRQGIYFTGRVRGPDEIKMLPGRAGNPAMAAIYSLRGHLLENLDRLYSERNGSADERAILRAMLLGDGNWLSPQIEAAFQSSGTYHVLVVSGWNVFAFAIPLLWLTTRTRMPEWLGTLLVAMAVLLFALLAEGGSSVSRAALMFLIYLGARYLYRSSAALNSVAAAALILLAMHPSDFWDGGFQLSFFAVLVLIAVAVPMIHWIAAPLRKALYRLEDWERDLLLAPAQLQFRNDCRTLLNLVCGEPSVKHPLRRRLRAALGWTGYAALWIFEGILFTSLIQVGLVLISVSYFHRLTWSGVLANFLILPLASGIVLFGLPLLFFSTLWWRAAAWGAVALGRAINLLQWIAVHSAHWQILNRRVPAPPAMLTLIFLISLLGLAALIARRSKWSWLAAAALGALCLILSLAPYTPAVTSGRLELAVLDVGQGDSLLVTFPNGATMLVDGGGNIPIPGSPPPRQDMGESVVSPYLWSRKIQKLDYVVLTHDHWDHMGGLESVLTNFRVGELWTGVDPKDRNMDWLRALAARQGGRSVRVVEGMKRTIGGVEVEALSPPADWAPKRVSNNDSIVLRLGYKGRHFLLPGDVEARMERRLAQTDEPLESEVLKVAHHGSRTSSNAEFLRRVAPEFGIISVGAFKRFGLPNEVALDRLAQAGVRVYRTDLDGTTTVSTDGHRLEISAFRESIRAWPKFTGLEMTERARGARPAHSGAEEEETDGEPEESK